MINVVVDTETTGLIPGQHEIIEIAIIEHTPDFVETDVLFHTFIKPLKPIEPEALAVNKIDPVMLSKSPTPMQARMMLLQWKEEMFGEENLLPLGHNFVGFDKQFLVHFLKDSYDKVFDYHNRDSAIIAQFLRDSGKLKTPNCKLRTLVDYFKIISGGSHDAISDAINCLKIYKKLVELIKGV